MANHHLLIALALLAFLVFRQFALEISWRTGQLRTWLITAIREATTPIEPKKPVSAHVRLMRLQAASALVAEIGIEQAAAATGVQVEEFRHWLARRHPPRTGLLHPSR